jgi:hypothetical protein
MSSGNLINLLQDPHIPRARRNRRALLTGIALAALIATWGSSGALADETCQSPYMPKITGEEEFVYVWTLGIEGVGDGSDKVVTIDVRKGSPTFGKVIDVDSVGGRGEAHHGGFADDRRHFWVAGLADSKIYISRIESHCFDRASLANSKLRLRNEIPCVEWCGSGAVFRRCPRPLVVLLSAGC